MEYRKAPEDISAVDGLLCLSETVIESVVFLAVSGVQVADCTVVVAVLPPLEAVVLVEVSFTKGWLAKLIITPQRQ